MRYLLLVSVAVAALSAYAAYRGWWPHLAASPALQAAPIRLILAGGPASGKGTQAQLIKSDFGLDHLSTGDILRSEMASGSALGLRAREYVDRGALVPDELVVGAVAARLSRLRQEGRGWILDGFPRTLAQAVALSGLGHEPTHVVVLSVDDDVAVRRVLGRLVDPVTGESYHAEFNPPPKEVEHRVVRRSDDSEEKLRDRLRFYHEHLGQWLPHVSKLQSLRSGVLTVPGASTPEGTYKTIKAYLQQSSRKSQ
eukprot:m51a1_g2366 putative adenylate kinase (254) ;mRNA; r:644189-645018